MKELDNLIKTVADGLKSMAQGVEKLAEKVEKIGKAMPAETTKGKSAGRRKSKAPEAAKKPAKKAPSKTAAAKAKKATAADTVLTIIKRSKKDVDTEMLMKKTGFDRKKIANIIYKLKKLDQIQATGKGTYTKK